MEPCKGTCGSHTAKQGKAPDFPAVSTQRNPGDSAAAAEGPARGKGARFRLQHVREAFTRDAQAWRRPEGIRILAKCLSTLKIRVRELHAGTGRLHSEEISDAGLSFLLRCAVLWKGGGEAERAGFEIRYTVIQYRGFESHPFRHVAPVQPPDSRRFFI